MTMLNPKPEPRDALIRRMEALAFGRRCLACDNPRLDALGDIRPTLLSVVDELRRQNLRGPTWLPVAMATGATLAVVRAGPAGGEFIAQRDPDGAHWRDPWTKEAIFPAPVEYRPVQRHAAAGPAHAAR